MAKRRETNTFLIPLGLCHESHTSCLSGKLQFGVNKVKFHVVLCKSFVLMHVSHTNMAAASAEKSWLRR